MDNTQIVRMLNTAIYRSLPTTRKGVTFKTIIRRLINFIDGRRLRRYMVLVINQALHIRDNYEDVEAEAEADAEDAEADLINDKMRSIYNDFSKKEQRCIKLFGSIIKKATEDDRFVMLNLLRILNFGPEPDEAHLIAMNIKNDAINNINDHI
jgi:hypothetical protein